MSWRLFVLLFAPFAATVQPIAAWSNSGQNASQAAKLRCIGGALLRAGLAEARSRTAEKRDEPQDAARKSHEDVGAIGRRPATQATLQAVVESQFKPILLDVIEANQASRSMALKSRLQASREPMRENVFSHICIGGGPHCAIVAQTIAARRSDLRGLVVEASSRLGSTHRAGDLFFELNDSGPENASAYDLPNAPVKVGSLTRGKRVRPEDLADLTTLSHYFSDADLLLQTRVTRVRKVARGASGKPDPARRWEILLDDGTKLYTGQVFFGTGINEKHFGVDLTGVPFSVEEGKTPGIEHSSDFSVRSTNLVLGRQSFLEPYTNKVVAVIGNGDASGLIVRAFTGGGRSALYPGHAAPKRVGDPDAPGPSRLLWVGPRTTSVRGAEPVTENLKAVVPKQTGHKLQYVLHYENSNRIDVVDHLIFATGVRDTSGRLLEGYSAGPSQQFYDVKAAIPGIGPDTIAARTPFAPGSPDHETLLFVGPCGGSLCTPDELSRNVGKSPFSIEATAKRTEAAALTFAARAPREVSSPVRPESAQNRVWHGPSGGRTRPFDISISSKGDSSPHHIGRTLELIEAEGISDQFRSEGRRVAIASFLDPILKGVTVMSAGPRGISMTVASAGSGKFRLGIEGLNPDSARLLSAAVADSASLSALLAALTAHRPEVLTIHVPIGSDGRPSAGKIGVDAAPELAPGVRAGLHLTSRENGDAHVALSKKWGSNEALTPDDHDLIQRVIAERNGWWRGSETDIQKARDLAAQEHVDLRQYQRAVYRTRADINVIGLENRIAKSVEEVLKQALPEAGLRERVETAIAQAKAKEISLDSQPLLGGGSPSQRELEAIAEGVKAAERTEGRNYGLTREQDGRKRAAFLGAYFRKIRTTQAAGVDPHESGHARLFLELCLKNGMCNESVRAFSPEQVVTRESLLERALRGKSVTVDTAIGPVKVGIVDASASPQIAQGISDLLSASIEDATVSKGGHLPDHLVDDNFWNITRPEQVQTHWASTGHRFVALREGRVVGTLHLGKDRNTIVYMSRWVNNTTSDAHPGVKPEGYHQMVNLAVAHDARRAKLATVMLDTIVANFRSQFNGNGIWMRADPPWHDKLIGLGFRHDPSMDSFLPPQVERTDGLPHAQYNRKFRCGCGQVHLESPDRIRGWNQNMNGESGDQTEKLQYFSMTRDFDVAK